MTGRFPLFASPPPRPPGRCPGCRRLALVPEASAPGGASPPDDWPHHCTRCGGRYCRRFGRSWRSLSVPDVSWIDDPEVAAQSLTLPRRFRIRALMIVVAWSALNLAPLSGLQHENRGPVVFVLVILNGFMLYLARKVRKLSPPLPSSDARGIALLADDARPIG